MSIKKILIIVVCLIIVGVGVCYVVKNQKFGFRSYIKESRGLNFIDLLPTQAKIIESSDLSEDGVSDRAVVLWMVDPKIEHQSLDACPLVTWGREYYEGPTRISLFDTRKNKLLQTLNIPNSSDNEIVFQVSKNIQKSTWDHYYGSTSESVSDKAMITPSYLKPKLRMDGERKVLQVAIFINQTTCISRSNTVVELDPARDSMEVYTDEDVNESAIKSRMGEF